jgi:DNA-binding NtrC family response regulator
MADGPVFPERWLHLGDSTAAPTNDQQQAHTEDNRICLPLDGSFSLDAMERAILTEALQRNAANVSMTARVLGTTREKLRYRVQKYGLKAND